MDYRVEKSSGRDGDGARNWKELSVQTWKAEEAWTLATKISLSSLIMDIS